MNHPTAFVPAARQCLRHTLARGGWGPWRRAGHWGVPRRLRHWLLDPGSLTAKLQRLSRGHLSVRILRQYWGWPALSERRALGLGPASACLIREVVLQGPGERPWVFARSVFPARTLTGPLRHLARLDNRPLGGYLFSQRRLGRSPMEVAELAPGEGPVPPGLHSGQRLWGRRSRFHLHGRSLLVEEIFLPPLLEETANG